MDACLFLNRYTQTHIKTHTRAFKVQNLISAKRFSQSRLDLLPELGYVYICYSILKPSNYALSCTPSHVNLCLTCVTAPMATSTPQIITPSFVTILHPLLTGGAWALQTILFLSSHLIVEVLMEINLCRFRAEVYLSSLRRLWFEVFLCLIYLAQL